MCCRMGESQRTTFRSWFPLPTLWDPGTEARSSGLNKCLFLLSHLTGPAIAIVKKALELGLQLNRRILA